MSNPIRMLARKPLLLFAISIAMVAAFGAGVSIGQTAYYQSLAVGAPLSRGEMLRVRGWSIFGVAGQRGGAITFMPQDGTGFYSIDNPGGQRLRISGGSRPGQYEYMTISHPGHVRINGRLQVTGPIVNASGRPYAMGQRGHGMGPVSPVQGGGKAENFGAVQSQVDELQVRVNQLTERVNRLQ